MTATNVLTRRRLIVLAALALLALALPLGLALAAGEAMPRSAVASGGSVSHSGYTLQAAIGQPAAGTVQGAMGLCGGFLCGPGAPLSAGLHALHLPLIVR